MTHGPLGLVILAVVSAVLVRAVLTAWDRYHRDMPIGGSDRPIAPLPMLIAVALVGTMFHALMDLPTSYGTRVLSPFSWRWYAIEWMPIVDVYLWIVLASGLYIGRLSSDARRRNAAIVLTFVAAIYGVRGFMHREALELAPRLFGPTLPPRCDPPSEAAPLFDSWPKPVPSAPANGRRCLVEIAALPTFLSPFDWRIIAQTSNSFEIHDVNVLDQRLRGADNDGATDGFWRQTLRYPNIWTPEVHRAAATDAGQLFLGFSRFPAARVSRDTNGPIVRFTDVRFVGGLTLGDQPVRRVQPFTLTVRFDADGRVISEKLGQ
jgi:hypothetical protein